MNDKDIEKLISQKAGEYRNKDVKTPGIEVFSTLVHNEKFKAEKRQNRQFLIFLAVAAVIITALILCLCTNIIFFLAVQALPLAAFFPLLRKMRRTEVEK